MPERGRSGWRTDVARRVGTPSAPTLCWALDMDPELCSDPPRIGAWPPSKLGSNPWAHTGMMLR